MVKLKKLFKSKKKRGSLKKDILIPICILLGIFLGWLGFKGSVPVIPTDNHIYVKEVIDGDTFKDVSGQRVRLLGIDSPEKGECFYNESKIALKDLIEGETVLLTKDISDKDRYGRLLRYIVLEKEAEDNLLVNDYLVRNGFAFDYFVAPDNMYRSLMVSARESAKKENLGLWSSCNYEVEKDDLRSLDAGPSDPGCIIKGNISEKSFGKTYLIPGCDNYERVKIDPRKGEAYFCSEQEAIDAGYRKATNCP